MKVIELTRGHVAIVDDEDFERLAQYRWHCTKAGYAARTIYKGGKRTVWMHLEILGVPKGFECDHKNGNKLDNRRENLRPATHSQNMMNRPARRGKKVEFKGVRTTAWGKFQARISANGKTVHLGTFPTKEAANAAVISAALIHHGEFANN